MEKLYINNDQKLGFTDVVISQEDVIKMYRVNSWDTLPNGKMTDDEIIDDFLDHDVFDIPKGFTEEQGRLMYHLISEEDFSDSDAEEIVERMIDLNIEEFTCDNIVIHSTIDEYTESLVDDGVFGNVDKRLYEYINFEQMGSDIINIDRPSHILDFNDEEYRIVEILK
jgi:hypothetical protein